MHFTPATEADAPAIVFMRTAVAHRLTRDHGPGHWSSVTTEKGVLRGIANARVIVARDGDAIVGTFSLQTKKPWAIDKSYFTPVRKALYLTDMAVAPDAQRGGIGRLLIDEAKAVTRAFPADAIRLDAYDDDAGAGAFYAKCGFQERGRVVYRNVPLIYYEWLA